MVWFSKGGAAQAFCKTNWFSGISRNLLRLICIALAISCLFGLNLYRSYSLGQYRTMYDNPVYRWRASIAVALSELRDPPLHGYVAYRSISDYLNRNGLALMPGEASPLPSFESVRELIYDPDRLDALFRQAATIPIDPTLPPVPIVGNEKGEAAYYYWAFRLFDIKITSLWCFYFLLLAASVLVFAIAFWRSSLGILLLMLYLICHLYMLDLASSEHYQTVHNSRFLPVLALLPSLHLAFLCVQRTPLRAGAAILAASQTALLFFVIFSRLEAAWQPVVVLAVSLSSVPLRKLGPGLWQPLGLLGGTGRMLVAAWPGVLVVGGAMGLVVYQHVALDQFAYATETRTHTFWDPLVAGTVSASPELTILYGMDQPPYSDSMSYEIARKYLVDHNDTASPIAVVQDGKVVGVVEMQNMAAYDSVQRAVFFDMLRDHPWLVFRAFFYDKPRAELSLLPDEAAFYRHISFWVCIFLAGAAGVVVGANGPPITRACALRAAWAAFVLGSLSLSTIFIFPTSDIPDTIFFFLLLLLTVPASLPLLLGWWSNRQGQPASILSEES